MFNVVLCTYNRSIQDIYINGTNEASTLDVFFNFVSLITQFTESVQNNTKDNVEQDDTNDDKETKIIEKPCSIIRISYLSFDKHITNTTSISKTIKRSELRKFLKYLPIVESREKTFIESITIYSCIRWIHTSQEPEANYGINVYDDNCQEGS